MSMVLGQSPDRKSPPYDAWPKTFIHAIEAALKEAMQRIKSNKQAKELCDADEEKMTSWLCDELILIAEEELIAGYNYAVFQDPVLDSPTNNADQTSYKKRPDLRFRRQPHHSRLVDRPREDAWFCECKIIEEKTNSSKTYKNYWAKGVQRFVDGSYAWAMPHGQMIAYVRWASDAIGFGPKYTELKKCAQDLDGDICITKHSRKTDKGKVLSDIQLRHLWFKFE